MDDTGDLAELRGRFNESMNRTARRNIDRRRGDVETGVAQSFGSRIGVLLSYIGQQDVFACGNPAHNRLSDRSGSNHYDHICHFNLSLSMAILYGDLMTMCADRLSHA